MSEQDWYFQAAHFSPCLRLLSVCLHKALNTHTQCTHTHAYIQTNTLTHLCYHTRSYSYSLMHAQMKANTNHTHTHTIRILWFSFLIRIFMFVCLYYITLFILLFFNRRYKASITEFRHRNSTVKIYNLHIVAQNIAKDCYPRCEAVVRLIL